MRKGFGVKAGERSKQEKVYIVYCLSLYYCFPLVTLVVTIFRRGPASKVKKSPEPRKKSKSVKAKEAEKSAPRKRGPQNTAKKRLTSKRQEFTEKTKQEFVDRLFKTNTVVSYFKLSFNTTLLTLAFAGK